MRQQGLTGQAYHAALAERGGTDWAAVVIALVLMGLVSALRSLIA